MTDWIDAAGDADLAEGEILLFSEDDRYVALARVEGQVYAFDDTCTHEECSLSEGRLDDEQVVCMCHGSVFDVRDGAVLLGPAERPLETYPAQVENGRIQIALPES